MKDARETASMADEHKTPTIFRIHPDGEVIALFPTIPADPDGNCLSYLHIGQHGAADPDLVVSRTRPATPDEYADLMHELTEIGYLLKPTMRVTRRMVEKRRATLARWVS